MSPSDANLIAMKYPIIEHSANGAGAHSLKEFTYDSDAAVLIEYTEDILKGGFLEG